MGIRTPNANSNSYSSSDMEMIARGNTKYTIMIKIVMLDMRFVIRHIACFLGLTEIAMSLRGGTFGVRGLFSFVLGLGLVLPAELWIRAENIHDLGI